MSFKDYLLKELTMPASTLSPMSVEEDKTDIKVEDERKIFPSDELIEKVAESADEAFWRVVVKEFKDKIGSKNFTPSKRTEIFKKEQKEAIKEWLKDNWTEEAIEKQKKLNKEIKPEFRSFEPPGTPSASGEARI